MIKRYVLIPLLLIIILIAKPSVKLDENSKKESISAVNVIEVESKIENEKIKNDNIYNKSCEVKENEITLEDNISSNEYIIIIDPGHQSKGNYDVEPLGPGSSETKSKVTSGTSGIASGLNEYELNLIVSIKLKEKLEKQGYTVFMTREENDVDISNIERAEKAYELGGDIFIRIHANGSENTSVNGMMTICQTANNQFIPELYSESYKLSKLILDEMVNYTGANSQGVLETDNMTGINWSKIPTTIIEMGYMSNYNEDILLESDEYQNKIIDGIVSGIDNYFK